MGNGMKGKLEAGKTEEPEYKEFLNMIIDPTTIEDEDLMLPVDTRAIAENFEEDIEDFVTSKGPVEAAKAFVAARKYWEENKGNEPEDERDKPLTAKDWKMSLMLGMEGGEEELMSEGDEEEVEASGDEGKEPD